jgi:hypothetical protein
MPQLPPSPPLATQEIGKAWEPCRTQHSIWFATLGPGGDPARAVRLTGATPTEAKRTAELNASLRQAGYPGSL